jgi:hypothetical protein
VRTSLDARYIVHSWTEVAHFQSQPIGLGRDLSTSALEMTYVE